MTKDSLSQIPVKQNKPNIISAASAANSITPVQTINTKKDFSLTQALLLLHVQRVNLSTSK